VAVASELVGERHDARGPSEHVVEQHDVGHRTTAFLVVVVSGI
jgi:hypothetical protein